MTVIVQPVTVLEITTVKLVKLVDSFKELVVLEAVHLIDMDILPRELVKIVTALVIPVEDQKQPTVTHVMVKDSYLTDNVSLNVLMDSGEVAYYTNVSNVIANVEHVLDLECSSSQDVLDVMVINS